MIDFVGNASLYLTKVITDAAYYTIVCNILPVFEQR